MGKNDMHRTMHELSAATRRKIGIYKEKSMELLEQIKDWLVTFPQWGEQVLHIDTTAAGPDNCGLFPLGQEILETKQDVLGNISQKLRNSFLLRRIASRQESAAVWLLGFQDWVRQQSLAGLAPRFGEHCRIRAEKGRLISATQTGTATYEVKIVIEFWQMT